MAAQGQESRVTEAAEVSRSEKQLSRPVRRSALRGLGGCSARNLTEEDCKMSTGRDSSSEGTKSNEEAIATSMMNLAIACIVVARQSNAEAHAAGKLES